jgi:hypothetical protein
VRRELAAAGLAMRSWWTDPAGQFGLSLAYPASLPYVCAAPAQASVLAPGMPGRRGHSRDAAGDHEDSAAYKLLYLREKRKHQRPRSIHAQLRKPTGGAWACRGAWRGPTMYPETGRKRTTGRCSWTV